MFGRELSVPVEAGNLLIWVWLEVTVLAAMMHWTSTVAKIIVRGRLRAGKWIKAKRKKSVVDLLPCNSDLQLLPRVPNLALTSIRILFLVLVAVSGIGIDAGDAFTQRQPTTHISQLNDRSGKGRPFNELAVGSIQDVAVVGCEDISNTSLKKHQAFIGQAEFSCNNGQVVGEKKTIVEVVWNTKQVRRILSGAVRPPNVSIGVGSCVSKEESLPNTLALTACNESPVTMLVERRAATDSVIGTCENGKPSEYLIVSNNPDLTVAMNNVTVAYVICEKGKAVFLQNTDRMIFLETQGPAQQQRLARKLANSLLSIVPDTSKKVYYGDTRRVTYVLKYYDMLMVALSALNVALFVAVSVYHVKTTKKSDFDPFSLHSTLLYTDSCERQFVSDEKAASIQAFRIKVDVEQGITKVVTEEVTESVCSTTLSSVELSFEDETQAAHNSLPIP